MLTQEQKASICGIVTVIVWSVTSAMLALIGDVPPFLIGAFCFLLGFFMTAAWWMYKGENIVSKFKMPLSSYAVGLYGIALYNAIYIYAFKTGPALEVNLLNYMWPAFLIAFGLMLEKKKPDVFAIIGCILCFIGCVFVFKSRGGLDFSGAWHILSLGVLCAFLWGSYSALAKYVSTKVDQLAVFFLIAGLIMLGLHFVFEKTVWPVSNLAWAMLVLYGLSRVTFFLWDYALKHGQARVVGSLAYSIPLFSTLSLVAVGFATYSHSLALGAALIITGCIVINFHSLSHALTLRKAVAA